MLSSFRRKVKIVCTLGPSSRSPEMIRALIDDGMDIARLNFSHGTHDFHRGLIATIRDAARAANKQVAIMQDLQGPKLRLGKVGPEGIEIKAGDIVLLYPEGATPRLSTHGKIPIPISAEIAQAVAVDTQVGARILFDDGKFATRVIQVEPPELVVEVEVGGKLTSNKGMNLPGTPLSMPCLTEKDIEDLKFGLSQNVDGVALSFVRNVQDIEILKQYMRKDTMKLPHVVAKIEREEAIEYMDSIIEVVDGLLIARGDMAVEIGAERVPAVQKQLIHSCNEVGVPVITATQMLESMISSPTPTRAEASDVANAVFDGTDAVMLSGETASGQYPREAVQTMVRVILEAERSMETYSRHRRTNPMPGSVVEAIESAASSIAGQVGAVAIACITHSGVAARTLAKYRPETPVLAIMDNEENLRRLAFVWGIRGALIPKIVGTDDLFSMVEKVLVGNSWAQTEDLVVVTAGVPTLRKGTTNMVKVHRVGSLMDRSTDHSKN
ncbi:MAG: pyruvate kinase [Bdellovibrionales bacterium GWB1_55_8]|nr:MAG: pyruvate kinase [Bdellovibrionales bacterium GWB1_55_8]